MTHVHSTANFFFFNKQTEKRGKEAHVLATVVSTPPQGGRQKRVGEAHAPSCLPAVGGWKARPPACIGRANTGASEHTGPSVYTGC